MESHEFAVNSILLIQNKLSVILTQNALDSR